jgi:hypothetical protein
MLGLDNACDLMANFVSMSLIITTIGDFFNVVDCLLAGSFPITI